MSQEHRRQKKLARHKKNREQAQRRARAETRNIASHDSPAHLLRLAKDGPFGPAYVSGDWEPGALPALMTCVITRRLPDGRLLPATALVDRTCLGIKNATVLEPMLDGELAALVSPRGPMAMLRMRPCEPLVAQSVVYHGLDYAATLDFKPHQDFPAELFGPRPAVLLETPLAHPQRPLYVSGPDDQVRRIVAHLEARVGAGNYDVVATAAQRFNLAASPELAKNIHIVDEDDDGDEDEDDLNPVG